MPELTSPHPIGEHAPQQSDLPAPPRAHALTLENRARLSVTGVREVESFDEESVVLHTAKGVLVIRGQSLHLQTLSIEGGQVAVDGTVDALLYEEPQKQGGFFSRLFR